MRRTAREVVTLDALEPGDHVGWIVRRAEDFARLASGQVGHGATAGDKVLLFGFPPALGRCLSDDDRDGVETLDPCEATTDGSALDSERFFTHFREQHVLARRQGFRGLRVIADMDRLRQARPIATIAEFVDFEQRLDRFVADTDAVVVCAYRPEHFRPSELADVMCVHPHTRGAAPEPVGFQVWSGGGDVWRLSGDVDVNSVEALRRRLNSAAAGNPKIALDLTDVRFIDVAGLRAVAALSVEQAVSVTVGGIGETMHKCWTLLGLDTFAPRVELTS